MKLGKANENLLGIFHWCCHEHCLGASPTLRFFLFFATATPLGTPRAPYPRVAPRAQAGGADPSPGLGRPVLLPVLEGERVVLPGSCSHIPTHPGSAVGLPRAPREPPVPRAPVLRQGPAVCDVPDVAEMSEERGRLLSAARTVSEPFC